MKILKIIAATALSLSSMVASASTILTATDGDVNFTALNSFTGFNETLAIFENESDLENGNPIFEIIDFEPAFSGAPVVFGSVDLGVGTNFVVGLFDTGSSSWIQDIGFAGDGDGGFLSFGAIFVMTADAEVQAIPVPASVWLFASGLLGLIGVSRRKI